MRRLVTEIALLAGLTLGASLLRAQVAPGIARIDVGAGKTFILDTATDIERISVAAPEVADIVGVNMRSAMINGKVPGETSAVVWLTDGTRKQYDVIVSLSAIRLESAKEQISREFGDKVHLTGDTTAVYITGTVKDLFASQRAESIAETIGKAVNLLNVETPPQEQQILLKVKFADVDRSKSSSLGANFIGAPQGFPVNVTTGANSPPRFSAANAPTPGFTLSDALNILMFDPHLNLGATIQALQSNNVLQILAEPNLLAMNNHEASFVAGGEFPFPTLQGGGSGVGQVTIQFREFGIKLKFTPTITPRGTIRLHVAPEVSSLDYANALTVQGSTVPALNTRKIETEVELESGQAFAIAGLLDQRTTEALSKIPGLADIPILGKLFTSKTISRSNSELLVIVTPELVAPIPTEKQVPGLPLPRTFLDGDGVLKTAPQTPGPEVTGPLTVKPPRSEIPVQEMQKIERDQLSRQTTSGGGSTSSRDNQGSGVPPPTGSGLLPMQVPVPAGMDQGQSSPTNQAPRRPGQ